MCFISKATMARHVTVETQTDNVPDPPSATKSNTSAPAELNRSESRAKGTDSALNRSALTLPIRHVARPAKFPNTNLAFSGDDETSVTVDLDYYSVSEKPNGNSGHCTKELSRRELLKKITAFASRSSGGITASLNRCYRKCSFPSGEVSLFFLPFDVSSNASHFQHVQMSPGTRRNVKSLSMEHPSHYRPQRSCTKDMFLHLSVSHSVHRGSVCLSACWDAHLPGRYTAPGKYTPFPWVGTPRGRYPPGQVHPLGRYTHPTPWQVHPPGQVHPP